MGARLRLWWQQTKQHRVAIGVLAGVIVALVIVIVLIFLEVRLYGRIAVSGGGLIMEFEKVVCGCFGKNFRTQVVS